jgi:hypothetical protein
MTQSSTNSSKGKKNPSNTVGSEGMARSADQPKPVLREILPKTMSRGTRDGDSTLPKQNATEEPKWTRGRGGYDYGEPSAERTSASITDRRDLSLALALPPFHEIDRGLVIRSVSSDTNSNKNEGATTIYYHLIGDPYKRDSNIEGAASLLVPAQLLGLVKDLHEVGRKGTDDRKDTQSSMGSVLKAYDLATCICVLERRVHCRGYEGR